MKTKHTTFKTVPAVTKSELLAFALACVPFLALLALVWFYPEESLRLW